MGNSAKSVTIAGIERTTAMVGVVLGLAIYLCAGATVAAGAIAGCAFMIVNLFLLAMVGHGIVALGRAAGRISLLGILLIPLKLLFFIGVSYLIVSWFKVDAGIFVAGVLTQPAAILIEIWRTAPGTARIARPEIKGNEV
ncbi:MAG TPA: hypothetical protein VMD75_06715 [Candidatus Binataceae bacterium]|nr:hypothetical protein [Candidatus Binataceae bacterium]